MIMNELKNTIRKELNSLRNSLSNTERNIANSIICNSLSQLKEVIDASLIAAYMPIGNEVDLTLFLTENREKRTCFPRYATRIGEQMDEKPAPLYEMAEVPGSGFENKGTDIFFKAGKYGILEPVKKSPVVGGKEIDVWLIPGLGFDMSGNRIGRGGGVYDRLLKGVPGIKIGIGYDIQMIDEIPQGKHDQCMDFIVTQKKIIRITD